MLTGIYSAASALKTAEFNQDVIATNLAHLNVPGFRRSMMVATASRDGFAEEELSQPGFANSTETLAIDFNSGPMVDTGRSLDVALAGDGFFAVQGEDEVLYTRNGAFQVGAGGTLVNSNGMPILGENGPISIPEDVSPGNVSITSEGVISANGEELGQLRLTQFADNTKLQQVGTTLFSATNAQPTTDGEVGVIQGVREQSNVQPMDELVAMIVSMRYHEAAQRVLKSIDGTIEKQTSS